MLVIQLDCGLSSSVPELGIPGLPERPVIHKNNHWAHASHLDQTDPNITCSDIISHSPISLVFVCLFVSLVFSRAAPEACGGSQARVQIGAVATGIHHSHSNAGSQPHLYTTAHGNAGSLTHWARLGIKPATSWFLDGFINHWAMMGIPPSLFWIAFIYTILSKCRTQNNKIKTLEEEASLLSGEEKITRYSHSQRKWTIITSTKDRYRQK